jgi:hypothetical protein
MRWAVIFRRRERKRGVEMRRFASAGWLVEVVFVLTHIFFIDLGFTRLRLVITAILCVASRQGVWKGLEAVSASQSLDIVTRMRGGGDAFTTAMIFNPCDV